MPDTPQLKRVPIGDIRAQDDVPLLELRYMDYGESASSSVVCALRMLTARGSEITLFAGELPGLINALIDAAYVLLPEYDRNEGCSFCT